MSLAHLFDPPKVPRPANVRRVTLVDVETSEEAAHRQRVESLERARKAKQAIARQRVDETPEQQRERRLKEKADWYSRNRESVLDKKRQQYLDRKQRSTTTTTGATE
jgi:hypothetical protein